MRRIIVLLILLCLLVPLFSCEITPAHGPQPPVPNSEQEEQYDALFDKKNHISLKLDISEGELAKMQRDYETYASFGSKSPIYRMADLYVTITAPDGARLERVIPQVGVRMKGNTSRQAFYSEEEGMYNLIHFKVSFQETFDDPAYYGADALLWEENDRQARKSRTFATLEKIDLRWNRNDDTTYIREGYAYDLYRAFGVLAPMTTIASLDIGSDHAGVYTLYEPVDKIFLEKRLPESALGGDLYKCGWTGEGATFTRFYSYGIEEEDKGEFYIYDLKTNKKTSTHESLRQLISTINQKGLTKEAFASVVDVTPFLYYTAVSYIIGNPDDLRNNYNNTYIYFRPDTGKLLLIPYDMDRGLGVNVWNPYGDGMTTDSPYTGVNIGGHQKNPLFTKTVQEGGFLLEEYNEILREVATSPLLTDTAFDMAYNQAKGLYQLETTPSKRYHNAWDYRFHFDNTLTASPYEGANMSFYDYIEAKLATLNTYLSGGSVDGPDIPIQEAKPYIRADFTGWEQMEEYRMTKTSEAGVWVASVVRGEGFRFKVYDETTGRWYGAELYRHGTSVNCADTV